MASLSILVFVLLTTIAVGAAAYAILLPRISLERKAETRLNQMKGAQTTANSKREARDRVQEAVRRRKSVQASLKAIEEKQKQHVNAVTGLSLERRIEQAGLSLGVKSFVAIQVAVGFLAFFFGLVFGLPLLAALLFGGSVGFVLPRWFLSQRRKKRHKRFVEEFANAIDVIVRGIKSGLPLNDTLRMVAAEAKEPVGSEFRRVVEGQQLGLSTSEAVERLYQNMPMPETNFFSIVITIQSQAGGNLSEALANLSRVLRDRKKMREKIQAMSMEAKASGGIIAALPPLVALFVFLTTPEYIGLLFSTTAGNIVIGTALVWMSMGVLTMKKMIAFDF